MSPLLQTGVGLVDGEQVEGSSGAGRRQRNIPGPLTHMYTDTETGPLTHIYTDTERGWLAALM